MQKVTAYRPADPSLLGDWMQEKLPQRQGVDRA